MKIQSHYLWKVILCFVFYKTILEPRDLKLIEKRIFCGLQNFTWLSISVGDEMVTDIRFLGWILTFSHKMLLPSFHLGCVYVYTPTGYRSGACCHLNVRCSEVKHDPEMEQPVLFWTLTGCTMLFLHVTSCLAQFCSAQLDATSSVYVKNRLAAYILHGAEQRASGTLLRRAVAQLVETWACRDAAVTLPRGT